MPKTLTLRLITPVDETIIADHIIADEHHAENAAKFADAYVNLYGLTDDVDITMTDNNQR